ncbi:MAG TPA: TfuA-like protein [Candidatus Eremiobacteraceae bacterium]|nr:TfuA-like protein [Candidatus Eremiobacteraceae bacterium]
MQTSPDVVVFAGPSLCEAAHAAIARGGFTLRPPAERGDVEAVVRERAAPGTIVLADGHFHQHMAVGHREIRGAMRSGWRVWGVSSIGAIRAYELRRAGMRGWGRVYGLFSRFRDFQDDEVALLNDAEPPYTPASEPLVHLRVALAALMRDHLIAAARAVRIAKSLKSMWYGDRTLALFRRLASDAAHPARRDDVERSLERFDRFRIKQRDLAALLTARSWSAASDVSS